MKRKPDLRLSWRDPAMPLLRDYSMPNGSKRKVVDPDYEHRYREMLMEYSDSPNWRNDPTYEMRRKKK